MPALDPEDLFGPTVLEELEAAEPGRRVNRAELLLHACMALYLDHQRARPYCDCVVCDFVRSEEDPEGLV